MSFMRRDVRNVQKRRSTLRLLSPLLLAGPSLGLAVLRQARRTSNGRGGGRLGRNQVLVRHCSHADRRLLRERWWREEWSRLCPALSGCLAPGENLVTRKLENGGSFLTVSNSTVNFQREFSLSRTGRSLGVKQRFYNIERPPSQTSPKDLCLWLCFPP